MLTRRRFLTASAFACLAPRHVFAAEAQPEGIVVQSQQGALRGEVLPEAHIFRGVPFAQPPVGELRFRPPLEPMPWKGVRDAVKFAPAAVQPGNPEDQSEDCLYLNVWTPKTPGPHPVFVWIHGGGFTSGSAFDPLFDGSRFARDGVICVTVPYRLGVFGFLDWSPVLGDAYAGSGNNGLRDLVAALRWVQKNIAAFGGDPRAVTIGGESAGAKLADVLMGVPEAQPLFHQVISESGGAERVWEKEQALAIGAGWGKAWSEHMQQEPASALHADARTLVKLQQAFSRSWPAHFPLRPEVDGTFVQRKPLDMIRSGLSRGKRLLLGTNLDESALFLGPDPKKDPGPGDLGNLPVEEFSPVAAHYAEVYPELSAPLRRIRSTTAEEYWIPSMRVAESLVASGGQAFVYRLDEPAEHGAFRHLAYHSYDLHFVWEKFDQQPSASQRALSLAMHTAWVQFIKRGTPSAPGLPIWPAFTLDHRKTMIFNAKSEVQSRPHQQELELWKGKMMR